MANIKRIIREEGIVISKEFKNATEAFEKDGKTIPATEDRFIIKVASGARISAEEGFENVTFLDFKVDKTAFDKFRYLMPVVAEFEFSSYGMKPISISKKV